MARTHLGKVKKSLGDRIVDVIIYVYGIFIDFCLSFIKTKL